jgi:hypothetical protein
MYKFDFINEWFSLMFRFIKRSRGYEYKITKEGFMSRHLFSLDNPAEELTLIHLFRILVNWAMLCSLSKDYDEFMNNWICLGEKIRDFANSERADQFNDSFNPKNN